MTNCETEYWRNMERRRTPSHDAVRAFVVPRLRMIQRHIDASQRKTVLDVGCGNGYFTWYWQKIADVTGLDMSPGMLKLNPCNKLVRGSALELPFDDNSFDLVFCANLLHHLDEPGKALQEMGRVSRYYVVLVEPNRDNPVLAAFLAIVPRERRALKYTARYLAQLINESMLRVEYYGASGYVTTNRTPNMIIPILRGLEKRFTGNMFHTIIAYKNGGR